MGAVIITGGSRGLGLAFVRDALSQGRIVATCSRHETADIAQLRSADPEEKQFMWRGLDVTDASACKKFVKQVAQRYVGIHGLINNAGQSESGLLTLTQEEMMQRLLAVNLAAVIRITRLVAPYMLRENGGSIVNIGSIAGVRGVAGLSVYGASKSALDGFSRCLARELGPRQVRVNVVSPGLLMTEMANGSTDTEKRHIASMTPMGRLGAVEDVVGLVRFLLSADAAFVSGQSIVVDGGFTA